MTTTILHISDLHFGDPDATLNRIEVSKVFGSLLARAGQDALVVLSGDITYQGQKKGYSEALDALQPALEKFGISGKRVIVCPGNHDIVKSAAGGTSFEAFDAWSAGLRNDKHCTFNDIACRRVSYPEAEFLVINSAYHGNSKYGLIELEP